MDAGFKSDGAESASDEAQIRLLVCRTCKTIEELPDWDGRVEDDLLLNISVAKHGDSHTGNLLKFPFRYWAVPKVKEEIVKQIRQGSSGLDIIGEGFYATKSQFGEDAMTCWGLHNRPTGQCDDYKSEKKLLKPPTSAERKELKMEAPGKTGPKVYLCDFCPVKSYNMKMHNKEKGLYN
jgi:hypothetical protein